MKKIIKYKVSFFFLLLTNFLQSQEIITNKKNDSLVFDNKIHKSIYEIKIAETHISIELIAFLDGNYNGNVCINLTRYFNHQSEDFVGKVEIEKNKVGKLVSKLQKIGIEKLNKNDSSVIGLDGDDTYFNIITNQSVNKCDFWELLPSRKIEKNASNNRRQAYKIICYLNKKMNFEKKYKNFRKRLPKGKYFYGSGIVLSSFEVK